ncbi:PspC domain-containing protein [Nocardioides jiangxiensis]|uniref:PspC domain-containing protein n=1 Tax=Nocardioides jiangxiensis TaxID=3064524 RepID=A0ABT9AZW9_9ACTN|nr:PspC domain-containing protein [Nocardioides sp. WY-20]MDO7867584.1 PspC domain-containing protein [Nocardioides sp. WY-20]
MDENITPPAGDTPPPPPPGGHEHAGDQPGDGPTGPRVSGADIRDVTRLLRSTSDRHVAGVAGGLARHLDIDPILVRVGFVVLTIFGGAGLFLYGALWILLPDDSAGDRAMVDLDPRNRSLAVLVVGALAAVGFLGNVLGFGGDHDGVFFPAIPLLVVAGIAFVVIRKREWRRQMRMTGSGTDPAWTYAAAPEAPTTLHEDARRNPEKYRDMRAWTMQGDWQSGYRWVRDPRKKGPLLFWIALPLIAVALGILGVVDLGGTDVIPAAYPALALAIVAALLLLGSFWGRAGGLIFLGLLLIPVTLVSTVAHTWDGRDITYAPTSLTALSDHGYSYHEDTGRLVLDLTRVADPASLEGHVVEADLAVGEIEVIVPDDINVRATAKVNGPGGFQVFGQDGGGIQTSNTAGIGVDTDDAHTLRIRAEVNVGHIIVRSN